MSKLIIRPFKASDRQAVQDICADTADKGEPVENFFPDRESISDLISSYYTDFESESLFVAEDKGQVIGYIMGCFDNRRYGLAMTWMLIPKALFKAFKNGIFFKHQFWGLIGGMMQNWPRLFAWRKQSFHSHVGHLHIGVAKNFRHQHIGNQLLGALLNYAKGRHIEAITASVNSGNQSAMKFFENSKFEIADRYPMVMYQAGTLVKYESLLYVKKI